jgi:hypothetical protein
MSVSVFMRGAISGLRNADLDLATSENLVMIIDGDLSYFYLSYKPYEQHSVSAMLMHADVRGRKEMMLKHPGLSDFVGSCLYSCKTRSGRSDEMP